MPLFGGFAQARNFGKGGAGRPPGFITADGSSLGTIRGGTGGGGLATCAATTGPGDPPITGYSIVSGSLPPGLSFDNGTAAITGNSQVVNSNTTYTFTVQASSPSGNVQATFSVTIRPAIVASWTQSVNTTFNVPLGTNEVEILMIASGGSGGSIGGGGGGGGIVYTSSYPVTPGASMPVVIGDPGLPFYGSYPAGNQGNPATFGTLTAVGGGRGGGYSAPHDGGPGGSGGGGAHGPGVAGPSTQAQANPGVSGLSQYGSNGAAGVGGSTHSGAGGGGAGGTGTAWQQGYPTGGSGAYFSEYSAYGTPGGHFAAGGGGGGWSGHIYGPGAGGTGGGGNGGYNGNGTAGTGHGSGSGAGGHPAPAGQIGSPGAIFIKY